MMTARCNEVLSVIGLIEDTDTSTTSVDGTEAYSFPTNYEFIRHVQYDGYPLKLISFQEYEQEKTGNVMPETNPPSFYVIWNEQLLIVPTPSNTGDTIKIYGNKRHPYIDNTAQTTIDIPTILHFRMCNGVIADMFAKDINAKFYDRYQKRWDEQDMPAFFKYKMQKKYRGGRPSVVDCDSSYETEYGVI